MSTGPGRWGNRNATHHIVDPRHAAIARSVEEQHQLAEQEALQQQYQQQHAQMSGDMQSSSSQAAYEASESASSGAAAGKADERPWVQCNRCDKWRALPLVMANVSLPDEWFCELNTYDPLHNSCDQDEEKYEEYVHPDKELKSFFKVWSKRIKVADKAETRLPPSAVTRGRKRRMDVDWIQCSNPVCGKWRAITVHGMDTHVMLRRLNRNPRGGWNTKETEWFCSMNSWDETTASCAAPQEAIWDCRWNLGN